jgi:tetratricopeptide (TPR) repeat protein
VRDGAGQRKVDSGQYLLAFEGDPSAGSLSVIDRKPPADESQQWFDRGIDLEVDDPKAAIEAYEKAIAADPDRIDARINLGLMLHETGNLAGAEQVYREAVRLSADDGDPVLHYNLAILLEDMERVPEAVKEYDAALTLEPAFADCHYNLALLYEKLKQPREAIRHMAQYRKLTAQ